MRGEDDCDEAAVQNDIDEYLGTTFAEAARLAAESGRVIRDMPAHNAWYTSDLRSDRINVWLNVDGRVERASEF